jgi:flagellar basal-body rod modification protein FlgD
MSTGLNNIANASKRNAANSLAATAVQSQGDKDRKTIAQNFDAFLNLLTTQLRNQSPLDPLDANQFTQQLVQFSSVEQQLKTNDYLAEMAKNFAGSGTGAGTARLNAASAASLIGVQVSASTATQRLSEGANGAGSYTAAFPVRIQSNYSDYQVTIRDAQNNVVYAAPWQPPGTGDQAFQWNGRRPDGTPVDPNGSYRIEVSGALVGGSGARSLMLTERTGVVTSVDLSGAEELVTFNGVSVPLSRITRVAQPAA